MRFGVAHDDSLARAAAGILDHVLVVAAAATLAVSTPLPVPPAAAAVEQGSPLFESRCARCHAGGGNSIPFNGKKDLSLKALEQNGYADESAFASLLRNGGMVHSMMRKRRRSQASSCSAPGKGGDRIQRRSIWRTSIQSAS